MFLGKLNAGIRIRSAWNPKLLKYIWNNKNCRATEFKNCSYHKVTLLKMSGTRFFKNTSPDYVPGQLLSLNRGEIKEEILVTAHQILQKGKAANYDGGIYVGPCGIAYMVLHLVRNAYLLSIPERQELLAKAQVALDNHLQYYRTLRHPDR